MRIFYTNHIGKQQKRALAMANSAKSIKDISPQASVYVPILGHRRLVSGCLSADPLSEWHLSALISSAVESVTLPTRLRPHEGLETWMPEEGGIHNIFNLQATIPFTENTEPDSSMTHKKDALVSDGGEDSYLDEGLLSGFEFDFTPPSARRARKTHVFSQVLVIRYPREHANKVWPSGSRWGPGRGRPTESRLPVQRYRSILLTLSNDKPSVFPAYLTRPIDLLQIFFHVRPANPKQLPF
jgi:hypothetical protein